MGNHQAHFLDWLRPDLIAPKGLLLHCAMAEPERPKTAPTEAPAARTKANLRLEREAAALRRNLLRRKQQARARQARKPDTPES